MAGVGLHAFGYGEQLHAVAQLGGVIHVSALQRADACRVDAIAINGSPEGQSGQDGDFVGGIKSLNICGWVRFRVTQILGVAKDSVVIRTLLGHPTQDVIRGAIDDSAHALNAVAAERLLERLNDWNPAANGGFNQHVNTCGRSC